MTDPAPPTFDALYREHIADVWRMLFALGVREADLADACQEVFVVVLRRLPEFDGRAKVTTWLYAIALRVASSFRRRAHNRREELVSEHSDQPSDDLVESAVDDRRALARVRDAIAQLDDDRRAAFVLFELHEMTLKEVSETLGCPLQTAYSRLVSARKFLAERAQRPAREGRSP
ncbi:MAG: sigma-70 family RNA polymerase sigma factor [Myxococcales bacterium]|nr:sigma-70 family RNA polymerase sigma factor [Myxococcales bacterium]